jgi:hypothetical protein
VLGVVLSLALSMFYVCGRSQFVGVGVSGVVVGVCVVGVGVVVE